MREDEWFFCPHHHTRHHRRKHDFTDLLFATLTRKGIHMSEAVLDVTPTTKSVTAALGSVRDAEGNVVASDSVASGAWSVDNAAVATIAVADGLTTDIALTGAEGTANVSFTGSTAAGVAVTGAGQIVVAVGAPVTVDVTLTADVPPVPVPAA